MSLNAEHRQIKAFALRTLHAKETSREDTVVFERCPMCNDNKDWRHRLNVRTGFYWCYRHSCTCRWPTLFQLLLGQTTKQILDTVLGDGAHSFGLHDCPEDADTYSILMYQLHPSNRTEAATQRTTQPRPLGYTTLPDDSGAAKRVADYARSRAIPTHVVECGYVPDTFGYPWCQRLIFPVVGADGIVKGSVGRAVIPGTEPKYYSDVITEHMVWGLDRVIGGEHIAMAEGVISALAVPRTCVATLSKQFNHTQAELIAASNPASVTVMFDADVVPTYLLTVCRTLMSAGIYDVRAAILDHGDPADDKEQADYALQNAIPYNDTNMLRILYGHAND